MGLRPSLPLLAAEGGLAYEDWQTTMISYIIRRFKFALRITITCCLHRRNENGIIKRELTFLEDTYLCHCCFHLQFGPDIVWIGDSAPMLWVSSMSLQTHFLVMAWLNRLHRKRQLCSR